MLPNAKMSKGSMSRIDASSFLFSYAPYLITPVGLVKDKSLVSRVFLPRVRRLLTGDGESMRSETGDDALDAETFETGDRGGLLRIVFMGILILTNGASESRGKLMNELPKTSRQCLMTSNYQGQAGNDAVI